MIYIITGGKSSGKTTLLKSIYNNKLGYGFKSEKQFLHNKLLGYNFTSMDNKTKYTFDKLEQTCTKNNVEFNFNNDTILKIENEFSKNISQFDNLYLDGIGSLELSKKLGLFTILNKLIVLKNKNVYLTINKLNLQLLLNILHKKDLPYKIIETSSLCAIIMASGNSTRFGNENKLLINYNGMTLFEFILNNVIDSDVFSQILVVTKFKEIIEICNKYPMVQVINNPLAHLGIAESIKLGIKNSFDFIDGYMFIPSDQPNISLKSFKKLSLAFKNNKNNIIVSDFDGIIGSPNIFTKDFRNDLLNIGGDIGGKQIMSKNKDKIIKVSLPKYENKDIDYKGDL